MLIFMILVIAFNIFVITCLDIIGPMLFKRK